MKREGIQVISFPSRKKYLTRKGSKRDNRPIMPYHAICPANPPLPKYREKMKVETNQSQPDKGNNKQERTNETRPVNAFVNEIKPLDDEN